MESCIVMRVVRSLHWRVSSVYTVSMMKVWKKGGGGGRLVPEQAKAGKMLIWHVGTQDPRRQRCMARAMAMLMRALM
jgi:hypothetical protein